METLGLGAHVSSAGGLCGGVAPASPGPVLPSPGAALSLPGVCGRTPEVQVALMRALAEDGPRMSCREVDAAELYRLRELLVDAEYLLPDDFQGLVSLRRLDVTVGRFPLSAGVFRGMPSLVDLEVTVVRRPGDGGADARVLSPGVFEGLEGLEHLGLRGRRARGGVQAGPFRPAGSGWVGVPGC